MTAMKSATPGLWNCPTCGDVVGTKFCATCGETRLNPRDLTVRGLVEQIIHIFSSIDSKVLRSFRFLLMRPGLLTVAYALGQRTPYIGPFQTFILANVLFFATQSLMGDQILAMPLDAYMQSPDWGEIARRLVGERVADRKTTLEMYKAVFDQAGAVNAKSLAGLMVLPFAVLPAILFAGSGRPMAVHVVFGLHFYAFYLCFLVALSGVLHVTAHALVWAGLTLASWIGSIIAGMNIVAIAVYIYVSTGAVYRVEGAARAIKAIAITAGAVAIFEVYRFVIFLITLFTT